MLLQWLQANGATSNNLNDAWSEMLVSKGYSPVINDGWYRLLDDLNYEGQLNDKEMAFWCTGGNLGLLVDINFSDYPNGTLLSSIPDWVYYEPSPGPDVIEVQDGIIERPSGTADILYFLAVGTISDIRRISATFAHANAGTDVSHFPLVFAVDTNNMLGIRSYQGGYDLYERVGGGFNQLDVSVGNAIGDVMALELEGNDVRVYRNGTLVMNSVTTYDGDGEVLAGILGRAGAGVPLLSDYRLWGLPVPSNALYTTLNQPLRTTIGDILSTNGANGMPSIHEYMPYRKEILPAPLTIVAAAPEVTPLVFSETLIAGSYEILFFLTTSYTSANDFINWRVEGDITSAQYKKESKDGTETISLTTAAPITWAGGLMTFSLIMDAPNADVELENAYISAKRVSDPA